MRVCVIYTTMSDIHTDKPSLWRVYLQRKNSKVQGQRPIYDKKVKNLPFDVKQINGS